MQRFPLARWLSNIIVFLLVSHSYSITTIPFPPTLIRQPPHEQLFQVTHTQDEPYKAFILECEAKGNPEPDYRWTKNGEDFDPALENRITQQPRSGTLIVNKPEDIDEGIYQCFAENIHGVAVSNAVFLRKSDLNSFPEVEPEEVFVIEGESLTINCDPPSGYPKPTVFWVIQSNSGTLHTVNNSRIAVDPKGNLHFSNVTKSDAVEDYHYACGAASLYRNEYKFGNRIILRVEPSGGIPKYYPPTVQYVTPAKKVAYRGETLELHCILGGTPLPEVRWSKKGSSLQANRISTINFGKTLKIKKVEFEDEGTYECFASNGINPPVTHSISVTIQAEPFWINAANDTNGAEEEDVRFECVAGGVPTPEVRWFMNGVPIEDVERNPRRKLDKSANVLTIENLEKSDTAVFQCNASNSLGYSFRDFYLNVLSIPPTITERPEPLTRAVISSVVTLKCRVFGAPNPKIKWLRDSQELKGDRYHILENGDLEITNVFKQDEGDYTCYATNSLGDAEAMGRLEVKAKTRITKAPDNFEVAAGKSATFRCNAEYDNTLDLTVLWLFNGRPIDYGLDRMVQASDNSLTITKTIEYDSGVYTCIAKTDLDQDEAAATLTVQDTPNPPIIEGVECDSLIALVKWRPNGDRRAPIQSYAIQFNTSFTPDEWEDAFVDIPAPDVQFKISMKPWGNYTFRVLARNKIGLSMPSNHSKVCTTPEDVPHRNPDKVIGRGTEKDNLLITWAPMPMIEQNAPGFFYKVFWKREDITDAKWNHVEINDWRQSSHIIANQPTFKPYRIKVEAHNERGRAHTAATEIIGHSGEDVPLEAPKNLTRVYQQDARSAMFSWSPVSNESVRGNFRGYKIQTWTVEEGDERLREEVVKANVTQALVTIFRPFSQNVVRVLAFNDMYNGPSSDSVQFMTPEGTPGAVANFDAIPLGSSALYLIWKRPLEQNGILTGYKIYYNEVNGTDLGDTMEREPPITDPRETRTKLSGLKPKTKYRLTIHATTKVGKGEPYFIEVETNEQAERAPDEPDFVWSHLPDTDGKAGVRVTWVPAVEGHPGSHFYVQYKQKENTEWKRTPMEEDEDSILVTGLELGSLYEMRVVAVDGRFEKPSKIEEIETGGMAAVQAPESGENFATAAWFIGMMCAIALLLLLLIIICLIKRNRGGKYSVHEKEAAQGQDLEYQDDGGFSEYTKPADNKKPVCGSRTSLSSSVKAPESETDSMVEYGEGESSKFNEDGSFIGQYGTKKKKDDSTSPSALATFV